MAINTNTSEEFSPSTEEAITDAIDLNRADADRRREADAARRLLEAPDSQTLLRPGEEQLTIEDMIQSKKKVAIGKKALGVAAGSALVFGGGAALGVFDSDPVPSEQKVGVTVEAGQGMHEILIDNVENVNEHDLRDQAESVWKDPANLEALKDGLDPGDVIKVPVRFD